MSARHGLPACAVVLALAAVVTAPAVAAPAPRAAESHDLRLVAADDLQGRSAYQPVVHAFGDRRILFVGHHAGEAMNPQTHRVETNGMSVLDVTDAAHPKYLVHVPPTTPDAAFTQHVQVCNGRDLPRADREHVYLVRTSGNVGYEVLDVTDPAKPSFLVKIADTGISPRAKSQRGNRETHKFFWDCATGVAYMNGTAQGWRVTRVLQAYDLADPAHPKHIRDFGLVGYEPGAAGPDPEAGIAGLHQPFIVGNRIYLAYNSDSDGVLQILDRDRFLKGDPAAADPMAPTPHNLLYPQVARFDMGPHYGVHTAKPITGFAIRDYADSSVASVRNLLLVSSEATHFMCQEARQAMFVFDITDETHPLPISTFQVPASSGDFCHRGGRFGTHSFQDAYNPSFDKTLVVLAYFNAGVRVVDIRDPFAPREVAHYVPAVTAKTTESCIDIAGKRDCRTAVQTNNVNVDDRGYIYAVDRASTGLHILQLTGEAARLLGSPAAR